MNKIFFLLFFICIYNINYSQRIQIDFGLRGITPLSDNLKNTYDFGKGVIFEPSISFLKNRFRVGPSFMFTNFKNNYSIGAVTSLNMRSTGAFISYNFIEDKKIRGVTFFKWHYTLYDDIIAPQKDYYGDTEVLLTGKGSAWSGGVKVIFNVIYIESGIEIYKPKSIVSNYVINQTNNGYEIYNLYKFIPTKLNFNQIYITIGTSIPDKIYIEKKDKTKKTI